MNGNRRMTRQGAHTRHGFTLIETAAAVALSTVIVLILARVIVSTTGSTDYIVVQSAARQGMQRAFDFIKGDLKVAASETVSVQSTSGQNDVLTLQTAGPFTGEVSWGAVDASGVWQQDWQARYRVLDSSLVRETLDGSGLVKGAVSVLVRDVEPPEGEQKAFEVEKNGPVYTLRLRLRRTFSDGNEHEETLVTSVHTRNQS